MLIKQLGSSGFGGIGFYFSSMAMISSTIISTVGWQHFFRVTSVTASYKVVSFFQILKFVHIECLYYIVLHRTFSFLALK